MDILFPITRLRIGDNCVDDDDDDDDDEGDEDDEPDNDDNNNTNLGLHVCRILV